MLSVNIMKLGVLFKATSAVISEEILFHTAPPPPPDSFSLLQFTIWSYKIGQAMTAFIHSSESTHMDKCTVAYTTVTIYHN